MLHHRQRSLFGLVLPVFLLFLSTPLLAQPDPGYYQTADPTNSNTLRLSLHLIIDDHSRIPYTSSSTDTWDVLELAE